MCGKYTSERKTNACLPGAYILEDNAVNEHINKDATVLF